jgi:ketosteroid isomerase-like protein
MTIKKIIQQFISAMNRFDVDAAVALFAENASISDSSVGSKFSNKPGVRQYLEKFFVSYKTVTKLESLKEINDRYAEAQVDFTGDFGHETGGLYVKLNADGKIISVEAHLD